MWAAHRRYSRLTLGLILGWIPFGASIGSIAHFQWVWIAFPLMGGYAVALIAFANLAASLRCPRCGSRFFAFGPIGIGHNPFARKCGNCKLPKWQCQSRAEAQEELSRLER